jgi:iron/zinc/copper transport system permease protein
MLLGAAIGALSSVLGLYIAWHAELSASASIVLTATALFALAFMLAPNRGLLWQSVRPEESKGRSVASGG